MKYNVNMARVAFIVCGGIGFYDFFIGRYGLASVNFTLSLINYCAWRKFREVD